MKRKHGFQRFMGKRSPGFQPPTRPVAVSIDNQSFLIAPRNMEQITRILDFNTAVNREVPKARQSGEWGPMFRAIRELMDAAFAPDVPIERLAALSMAEMRRALAEELPKVLGALGPQGRA